jgi:hypothetical protein
MLLCGKLDGHFDKRHQGWLHIDLYRLNELYKRKSVDSRKAKEVFMP